MKNFPEVNDVSFHLCIFPIVVPDIGFFVYYFIRFNHQFARFGRVIERHRKYIEVTIFLDQIQTTTTNFSIEKKKKCFRSDIPKPESDFTFPAEVDQTLSEKARFTYPNAAGLDVSTRSWISARISITQADFCFQTYGASALSHSFYPFKLDIGGLILGAFVGIGALLLIPKIMHILVPELALYGSTFGPPYRRS